LYTRITEKLFNRNTTKRERKMSKNVNSQKEISNKLMKGLLDLIILQFLNTQPMHGYQIITKIRKTFGVYFGPSTIYPLLGTLEKKGFVDSQWNMNFERPRKVYRLTFTGQSMLNYTEDSLTLICKKITAQTNNTEITVQTPNHPAVSFIKSRNQQTGNLQLEVP
jgi:DNA-binding PadR family transcriptional regulator